MNNLPQTPMEVLLGIDENGMTDARKLYSFLELAAQHFARWAKTNIEDNEFATENEDYIVFSMDGENPAGGRPGRNYKLTAAFAKKLAMQAQNERGEEARAYYISVEEQSNKLVSALNGLSPTTRALIDIELRQNRQQEQLDAQRAQIDGIKTALLAPPDEVWRKDIAKKLNMVAAHSDMNHQEVRVYSYK